MNEIELKKRFRHIISYIQKNDLYSEIIVWDRIVEKYSDEDGLIRSKT